MPVGAGASDVDHVLIGPAGVFTLNTKNHAGQHADGIEPATGRHSRLALIPVRETRRRRGTSRLQRPLGKIRDGSQSRTTRLPHSGASTTGMPGLASSRATAR
ncbi:nuclease-related domain-containing protein [Arthrobacter sp. ov118]|uniref:nuclease-related domain-containing protein n=1 Tax=Arthrobacter sp. ov118 TaxID=1761747 RepID=UPI003529A26B